MSSQDIYVCFVIIMLMFLVWNQEEVVKLIDVFKCIGCKVCQVVCLEWNELCDEVGYNYGIYDNFMDLMVDLWMVMCFIEYENEVGNFEWLICKDGCMYCVELGCLKVCLSLGVIVKYVNGIVDFNQDKCIGCGYCIIGCLFDILWILQKDYKVYKCSLCFDCVLVGMELVCVKICLIGVIVFGSKEDMKEYVVECIVDLKSCGYENVGLYDFEGVGGIYVMYVLYYVDKLLFYVGLVDQLSVSLLVSLWKGVIKLLVLLVMGVMVFVGFFYYVCVGFNCVDDEEDYG